MPSEYVIYRAYAGLNRPQSKLDYFLQGVGKLQGIAESNKRLELQERRLDQQEKRLEQDDERANERLELSKTQEERMREQHEYNKQKNIEDRKFSKQSQAWNSISSFAGQLPEGQRYNFMTKQAGNIMDDDFMQSQGIYDKMEAFKEAEEDGVAMGDMYFNMRNEDSADKIEQFLNMDVITDNSKKQVLQNRVNSIRKKEKEWEPFDIDLLSAKKQRDYKSIVESYNEKNKDLMKAQMARGAGEQPDKLELDLANQVKEYSGLVESYEKQAATAPLPVFTASTESLQSVADDDDLMTAFFGDESNNLDEFIEARSGAPKPEEIEVKTEVKTEEEEEVVVEEPDAIKQEGTQVVKSGGVSFEVPINSLNDDMKKLFESDYMSKIKNTRAKERLQVISNILGRKISEEESEALLSELSSIKIQALTKKGLEDIKKGVGASLKEKRYPQKAGRSTYRAQG